MRSPLMALSAVLACGYAAAAPAWPQEPESVAGVRLGAPLAESGLAACQSIAQTSPPCVTKEKGLRGEPDRYTVSGTGIRALVELEAEDGITTSLTMTVAWFRFEEFRETLLTRYGPPTSETTTEYQTRGGATVTGKTLTWTGKHVSITAMERWGDIKTSGAVFRHTAASERTKAKRNDRAREEARKF